MENPAPSRFAQLLRHTSLTARSIGGSVPPLCPRTFSDTSGTPLPSRTTGGREQPVRGDTDIPLYYINEAIPQRYPRSQNHTSARAPNTPAAHAVVRRPCLWYTFPEREVGQLNPNQNRGRLVAPIIITALLLLYYAGFFILLTVTPALSLWSRLLLGVAPLALMGVSVFVLVERIREVRSGEEDDLDRY